MEKKKKKGRSSTTQEKKQRKRNQQNQEGPPDLSLKELRKQAQEAGANVTSRWGKKELIELLTALNVFVGYSSGTTVPDSLNQFSGDREKLLKQLLALNFYDITYSLGRIGNNLVDIGFVEDKVFFEKAFKALREDQYPQLRSDIEAALRLAAFGLTIVRNSTSDLVESRKGLMVYFDHLTGLFITQNKKFRSTYCALCFKESCNIRQSHIVAKAILDIMMEGSSINSCRLSNCPKKLLQSSSAVCWYMLCGDCELSFGEIENWFVQEIFKPLYSDPDQAYRLPSKPKVDGKLYIFFLSLAFRALRWLTSVEAENIANSTAEVHLFMQALRDYLLGTLMSTTNRTPPSPADVHVTVLPTIRGDLKVAAYYCNRYLSGGCGWSLISSHGQPALLVHFGLVQVVVSSKQAFSCDGICLPVAEEKPFQEFGSEVTPETPYLDIPATGNRKLSPLAHGIVGEQIRAYGEQIKALPDSVLKQIASRRKGKPRTNRLSIAAINGDSKMKDALLFLPDAFLEGDTFTLPEGHRVWCRTLCSTSEERARFIFHIGKGPDKYHYCILELMDPEGYLWRAHVLHFYERDGRADQFRFDVEPTCPGELKKLVEAQEQVLMIGINKLLGRISKGEDEWPDMWTGSFAEVEGMGSAEWSF